MAPVPAVAKPERPAAPAALELACPWTPETLPLPLAAPKMPAVALVAEEFVPTMAEPPLAPLVTVRMLLALSQVWFALETTVVAPLK